MKKCMIVFSLVLILSVSILTGCSSTDVQETVDDIGHLGDRSTEGLKRGTEKEMYNNAKDIMLDNISTPSTAKFPAFDSDFVTSEDSVYTVKAFVDAENLMGAMVRSKFIIELKETDDGYSYTIVELQ